MLLLSSRDTFEVYGDAIRAIAPAIEFVWPEGDTFNRDPQNTEVVFFTNALWSADFDTGHLGRIARLEHLRWLHTFTQGANHPLFRRLMDRGTVVTRSRGALNAPIAQYILAMMLRIVKRMDLWSEAQREKVWRPHLSEELTGKTVGLVGMGEIGSEVARLARAFQMRVVACRRKVEEAGLAERVYPQSELHAMLAESDFVVLVLPLTSRTQRIIDRAALAAMRPGAWLINVSRGGLVDEAALIEGLRARQPAGAVLDVFEKEPLPAESPLWTLENAILTPHNSIGGSPLAGVRVAQLFLENLRRHTSGAELLNRVTYADLDS